MSFPRPGRVVSALITSVALVVVAACGTPDLDIEHETLDEAPKPVTGKAPPPGRYELAWKRSATGGGAPATDTDDSSQPVRLASGNVVVSEGDGVAAYDARTGKPTWHYREPARKVQALAYADDAVVLETFTASKEPSPDDVTHLVGLDDQTGERLWEKYDSDWTLQSHGQAGIVTADAEDQEAGATKLSGLEARTGKERWSVSSKDVGEGCRPKKQQPTVSRPVDLVGLTFDCDRYGEDTEMPAGISSGNVPRLYAVVDAATGAVQWARATDLDRDQATVRGYTVWSHDEEPPVVLDPRGRKVVQGPPGSSCTGACESADLGATVAFTFGHADSSGEDITVEVDTRTGKARQTDAHYDATVLSPDGTAIDAPASTADPSGLPDVSGVPTDPALGLAATRSDRTTVEVATGSDPVEDRDLAILEGSSKGEDATQEAGGDRPEEIPFAGTKDHIYTSRTTSDAAGTTDTEVAAYVLKRKDAKGEHDGVRAVDWPEPCPLLKGAPLPDALKEATRRPTTKRSTGDLRVPATACSLNSVHLVRIDEVARTEEAAKAVFPETDSWTTDKVDADEATFDTEGTDPRYYVRIGRYVASVADTESSEYDDEDRAQLVKLTNAVAKNLRAFAATR